MEPRAFHPTPETPSQLPADIARARECLAEGEALLDQGKVEEALALLQEAVRLDPRYAPARNKLGVCYVRQGELEPARREFLAAIEIDPRFAPAYSNLGNLHQEAGRLEEAVAAYRRALEIDPDYAIAHHNLGVVYRRMGRISESVAHLKKAALLEYSRGGTEAVTGRPAARWAPLAWIGLLLLLAYFLMGR